MYVQWYHIWCTKCSLCHSHKHTSCYMITVFLLKLSIFVFLFTTFLHNFRYILAVFVFVLFFCTVLCLVIFSYFWSVHYFVLQLNIDLRNLHSLLTCIIRPCETQLYFVCPNFIILLYVDVIFVYFRRYFQLPLDFFFICCVVTFVK